MNERTHIDLFSGIGGFALAARWNGLRTVAFCERDEFCQRVLRKHWPDVPICGDIHDFDGADHRGAWLLTGGFPCQPFSLAGKRGGAADDRALWPVMCGVIEAARPAWVLGENVPGIVSMELDRVLSDLERIGYAAWPVVVPACAADARHRRDRVWIVARNDDGSAERNIEPFGTKRGVPKGAHFVADRICANVPDAGGEDVFHDDGSRREHAGEGFARQGIVGKGQSARRAVAGAMRWEPEPDVGRVADGIPRRMDRLRGLGNAIVPQIAAEIIAMMIQTELPMTGSERGAEFQQLEIRRENGQHHAEAGRPIA